jgi:hypothetical protein
MRVIGAAVLLAVQALSDQSYKYKYFAAKLDWVSAEATCVGHGGHLATINTKLDNTRVFNRCFAERCWMGLNDRAKEGNFVWVDNSPITIFNAWAAGEPSNTADWYEKGEDEDCVYLHGRFYSEKSNWKKWGDHPCSLRMAFVCKIPVDYRYLSTPMDWVTAQNTCRSMFDGELAHIMSPTENENALGSCAGERCWIGLTDGAVEGEFQWTDGAALKSTGAYEQWAIDEPNNAKQADGSDEDCVYMHGTGYGDTAKHGKWGDHSCKLKQAALCEIEAQFKFQYFSAEKSWTAAEETCNSRGGNLANVQSFGQNAEIQDKCKGAQCWIGKHLIQSEYHLAMLNALG